MKSLSQHTEWLSMIEISGPFLAIPVLEKIFPQGLASLDTSRKRRIRAAYEEWRDAVENDDRMLPELHRAWVKLVLEELLEYDDSVLKTVSDDFVYKPIAGEGLFKPDFVLRASQDRRPMMFVSIMPEGADLEKVKTGDTWPVSVFERMALLCRDKGARLGLVTNGERWMLVNAPVGNTSSHVSWYARLWFQEPLTLKAFQSLLSVRRWFGPENETLPAMLEESLQHHEEVTDTLGEQVKRAVEVLVQCLDKADKDRNRELLHDVSPAELYEAGLTVMMRLVFILCAEERGLLLLGDSFYEQNYALSTLRSQLKEEESRHGHEILERRHDAWSRLLALFRVVYGGVEHEALRLPALGGSLFDSDRFPFLEGRAKHTRWLDTPAEPLPIDNRTVLLLLEALQILEQKEGALLLSYKALDVEQIGHVYEGLLEYTVHRLPKDTLGLVGSQKAKNPNISLAELESARLVGVAALVKTIEEVTMRSKTAITNSLKKELDEATFGKVISVCGGDMVLAERLRPFAQLLRTDAWGHFIFYRENSFAVTLGADRRETGTHYTPKSLTESIVETTLEPVVYLGPAEGKTREEWQLKSSAEILELKICDPAMGSGAFLVQVCCWLSERIVESWGNEETKGMFITAEGVAQKHAGSADPMPKSLDERLLIARRLVSEKCLYGVDLNPLAVELAKVSIWLITLAKGRPFGFLDHNLRSGDSLLGIHRLEQLYCFDLHADEKTPKKLFADKMDLIVAESLAIRKKLREAPIRDIRDVEYMKRLDLQIRQKLEKIEHIADAIIGEALASGGNMRSFSAATDSLSCWAAEYIDGAQEIGKKIILEAQNKLSCDELDRKFIRKPFHWVLEFPEVFERGGFDGIVGNPPFIGGHNLLKAVGKHYKEYLSLFSSTNSGLSDLSAFFFLRAFFLLRDRGYFGLIATNSICQGNTRKVGLEKILNSGGRIFNALSSKKWPGRANLAVSIVFVARFQLFNPKIMLDGKEVSAIAASLTEALDKRTTPFKLAANKDLCFTGPEILGDGLLIDAALAKRMIDTDFKLSTVLKPYISGDEITSKSVLEPSRWVIDFQNFPLDRNGSQDWFSLSREEREKLLDGGSVPQNYPGEVAADFPMLLKIVEEHVKPFRIKSKHAGARKRWWQFGSRAIKMNKVLKSLEQVIICSLTSKYFAFRVCDPRKFVFSILVKVFAFDSWGEFAFLSSSVHDLWAKEFCSTLEDRLRYTSSEVFDTLPFPKDLGRLNPLGSSFNKKRESIIIDCGLNLTQFYNLFHDAKNHSKAFEELREVQRHIDESILGLYCWDDLNLEHDFHNTKQGVRFTVSEAARREILYRLLKLNNERYAEEESLGLHGNKKTSKTPGSGEQKKMLDKDHISFDLFSCISPPMNGRNDMENNR